MDVSHATPVGPLPGAIGRFALGRLAREDLEALASLKLWCEVGVPFDQSLKILAASSEEWMRAYLGSLPCAIGAAPLDIRTLERARARYSRRRLRARAGLGTPVRPPEEEITRTNFTRAA